MYVLSNKVSDAREAMAALIQSRSLSIREDEPGYPAAVAELAWKIADAMSDARERRDGHAASSRPPPRKGAR